MLSYIQKQVLQCESQEQFNAINEAELMVWVEHLFKTKDHQRAIHKVLQYGQYHPQISALWHTHNMSIYLCDVYQTTPLPCLPTFVIEDWIQFIDDNARDVLKLLQCSDFMGRVLKLHIKDWIYHDVSNKMDNLISVILINNQELMHTLMEYQPVLRDSWIRAYCSGCDIKSEYNISLDSYIQNKNGFYGFNVTHTPFALTPDTEDYAYFNLKAEELLFEIEDGPQFLVDTKYKEANHITLCFMNYVRWMSVQTTPMPYYEIQLQEKYQEKSLWSLREGSLCMTWDDYPIHNPHYLKHLIRHMSCWEFYTQIAHDASMYQEAQKIWNDLDGIPQGVWSLYPEDGYMLLDVIQEKMAQSASTEVPIMC